MENNNNSENKNKYQDSSATGVLGAIIFFIAIMIGMYLLSKFM